MLTWHDVDLRALFHAHVGEEVEQTGDGSSRPLKGIPGPVEVGTMQAL